MERLCKTTRIVTVNGQFPGPTLEVKNGDSLVIKVVNGVKYNATIHWHGVRQMRNGWADGPAYVTQCPIKYGESYTYRFNIEDQEGTLFWHAHSPWMRSTVYGAIVIRPKGNSPYPFPKPDTEALVILGEWWIKEFIEMAEKALDSGAAPDFSDALLINGQPGDLFNCSSKGMLAYSSKLMVFLLSEFEIYLKIRQNTQNINVIRAAAGETVLLRFINAAIVTHQFVAIAGHPMTVVAVDASYTKPFTTPYLMLGAGQTADVLIHTNQPGGRYYIAAHAYRSGSPLIPIDNSTATAILDYDPIFPPLPASDDHDAVAAFNAGLKSPARVNIPAPVDQHLFITLALGLLNCPPGKLCGGLLGNRDSSSMNNISFVLPTKQSLLQAANYGQSDVFSADFPEIPPAKFDYTGNNSDPSLFRPIRATKIYRLKYGSVVQVVLQGTSILSVEEHPIHIHGYDFYVLAMGKGNYEEERDSAKFNLVDPPRRSTVGVPAGGWAAIRFRADNPGVWFVHCHMDFHLEWGMMTAFLVENGAGEMESTLPPPADLPRC
ncbi:Laccase-3 [Platanthera zijinensis]|uniref:laccase n=1 Tax=Platanthera zijinensis TaxID=2320716 RepID=A0AAP0GAD0_9ASPA